MTIELNTASWHYRLYNWIQIQDLRPHNLCQYLWSFVSAVLCLPITIGTYLIDPKEVGIKSHLGRVGAGFGANFCTALFICFVAAVLGSFNLYMVPVLALLYIPLIACFAFPVLYWGIVFCIEVLPKWKLKEKFCPTIRWNENNLDK